MDQDRIIAMAKAAGLELALAEHAEDVNAAAAQAAETARAMRVPTDPAVEPWPPMHVGGAP